MNPSLNQPAASRMLKWITLLIIVIIPLHGFITTWAASFTGGLLIWRAWKEVLLLVALLIASWLLIKNRSLRQTVINHNFAKLIGVFAALQFTIAIGFGRDLDAVILGLTIQLRIFAFFLIARMVACYWQPTYKQIVSIVLIPAGLVIGFGLLQIFVLPIDFLQHFGYEKGVTIPPFFTIDDQLSSVRIASTLRGPNPLGVYLILPLLLLAYQFSQTKKIRYAMGIVGGSIALYASGSRGAWVGLFVAMIIGVLIKIPNNIRLIFIAISCVALIVTGAAVYQYRDNRFVQDVILHDNPQTGGSESSNLGHLDAVQAGISDVAERPLFGCGAGCAGPASVHNSAGPNISENYYLQTAQESGLIGLFLLLGIFGIIARQLYKKRDDPMNTLLLASFIGILVANLFAHVWADDTIAYMWWGLAGLILYRSHHDFGIASGNFRRTSKSNILSVRPD